jgi:hypothetical protein
MQPLHEHLRGGFKDHFPEHSFDSPGRDRDQQPHNKAEEADGTPGAIPNALSRDDLPRPRI